MRLQTQNPIKTPRLTQRRFFQKHRFFPAKVFFRPEKRIKRLTLALQITQGENKSFQNSRQIGTF